eukprot:TRINITY_DN23883_c1_g1_i1.p1 TRINITY_DN23883_c1_g1~~TRINITY_DN23883_c1_g1_i1.p1  ORF type:complete len:249 (+),score=48.75 TRINITY_DN23883_c1_g1_i1:80-826(+)
MTTSGGSGCPMKAGASSGTCPMRAGAPPAAPAAAQGSCGTGAGSQPETLNPLNMMPEMSQDAAAGQNQALSKDREVSKIPRTDAEGNWVYPSPQQFYNALLRKNKEAEAETMDAVVRVHNVTNEKTWDKIMEWEKMHEKTCPTPTLARFVGKCEDPSWGAWWSNKFSYRGLPFDRHDWFVDRCGQRTVRYVIDYYDDPKAKNDMQITIEARPAFDTAGDAWDRLRRPAWQARRLMSALTGRGGADWGP